MHLIGAMYQIKPNIVQRDTWKRRFSERQLIKGLFDSCFLAERLPVHRIQKGISRCTYTRVSIKHANSKRTKLCLNAHPLHHIGETPGDPTGNLSPGPRIKSLKCAAAARLTPRRVLSTTVHLRTEALIVKVGFNLTYNHIRWQKHVNPKGLEVTHLKF